MPVGDESARAAVNRSYVRNSLGRDGCDAPRHRCPFRANQEPEVEWQRHDRRATWIQTTRAGRRDRANRGDIRDRAAVVFDRRL